MPENSKKAHKRSRGNNRTQEPNTTKENNELYTDSININDTLSEFSTNINKVSKIVDEKLSAMNQKIQTIIKLVEKIKEQKL